MIFGFASRYPLDTENKPITCPCIRWKKKNFISYVQNCNNPFSWTWFRENIDHITWMRRNRKYNRIFFGLSTVKTLICLVIRVVFPAAAPPTRIFDHQHKSERALGNFSFVRRKRTVGGKHPIETLSEVSTSVFLPASVFRRNDRLVIYYYG